MINFKPELVKLLRQTGKKVVETYPSDFNNLPVIVYEEEENIPYELTTNGEDTTILRYRIEIYSDESTSNLKAEINNILSSRGLIRVFSVDRNDIEGRRHTIMRFEGVYDLENKKIYRL